jgi:hypothetical protein
LVATPVKTPETKRRSAFSFLTPIICSGRRRREERAVYEAASTFIGAGFEEFEYADVRDPDFRSAYPASQCHVHY